LSKTAKTLQLKNKYSSVNNLIDNSPVKLDIFLHQKTFILLALLPLFVTNLSAKIVLKLFLRSPLIFAILTLLLLGTLKMHAQSDTSAMPVLKESLSAVDTIVSDSVVITDTARIVPRKPKQVVEEPVFYSSTDSMSIMIKEQTVLLWGASKVEYQDIELNSEHIISDLESQEIYASGGFDTAGVYFGTPQFKKGNEQFDADSINYNIKSGKGIIYHVKSEQGEGYLHSQMTKRDSRGHVHIKGGKYTTCEADDPHFYMALTKAIAIPNDKIVSGYAYLVLEDVPIPLLGIPFGFFPSTNQRGAGVIIPRYGEETTRGFFLREGGWYQPLGQYVDLRILGDYYSKGSWGVNIGTNYKVRYKFNGSSSIRYAENKDNSDASFKGSNDFKWTWTHRQDSKANPTRTFSATVNFSNANFDRNNSYNANSVVRQQKSSSISYTKRFPGTPFNLSLSANARQNSVDSTLTMDLPKGTFNATTVYPFRKKSGTGSLKWYENVGLSYRSEFKNYMHIKDTMLFESETWQDLNYGFKHDIPLLINLKMNKFKMLTISPSLSYSGVMNSYYIEKRSEQQGDEVVVVTDTIRDITYAQAINPGISFGLTPKVTGMFLNTRDNPSVMAVRHVMQPRASFSYVPDMSKINPNYYDTVYYMEDGEIEYEAYSYYDASLYKSPSFAKQSGSLSLGLSNNLEMKLKPKSDTSETAQPRKVMLLRNFNFSQSYNPFAEEYKWSDLSFNTSTALFKNIWSLNLTSKFSPYDIMQDTATGNYRRVNEYNYANGKGIYRFTNLSFSSSIRLKSKSRNNTASGDQAAEVVDEFGQDRFNQDQFGDDLDFSPGSAYTGDYVDFNIPWSLTMNYTYSISRPLLKEDQRVTNTVNFSGDFSLTPKWKIGFRSGYDFEKREVTMTNFNIYRDLHCWEMRFQMIPFGTRRSFTFYINAKASILKDLKYDKRQSWYDNL
jgi:hypothetical protein